MPEQNWLKHPRFRTLPSIEREILFRRHKGQSWVDIADEINHSESQAKSIYERAIEKLQQAG